MAGKWYSAMDAYPARDSIPKTVNALFTEGYVIERGPVMCRYHGCNERVYWYKTPQGTSIAVEIDWQGSVTSHYQKCIANRWKVNNDFFSRKTS